MSDSMSKVSICIPTYNQRPDFLRACIQSALAQTYPRIEVIVSENHSTNSAPQVIAEFDDSRLVVVRPPQHVSMAHNFIFAANQAKGDYLCFLSSDDLLHPDCCARLVPILDEYPSVVFAYSRYCIIDASSHIRFTPHTTGRTEIRNGLQEVQESIYGNKWCIVGALIRCTAYRVVGGIDPSFTIGFDWPLGLRLYTVGQVAQHDAVLVSIRDWGGTERATRFVSLSSVRGYRLIYDFMGRPDIVGWATGGDATLACARRAAASSITTALLRVGHRLPRSEFAQVVCELQRLDNSRRTRLLLWLAQTPLALPVGLTTALIYQLRVRVAQTLDKLKLVPYRQ